MHLSEQFVPQHVCLACDGCCRFKEEKSIWRPRMVKSEVESAVKKGLAEIIFAQNIDEQGQIKTTTCGTGHLCSFFEATANTCRIYGARPFECQLYPFILTKRNNQPVMTVHTNCPFVQEKRSSPEFTEYVEYLKKYFSAKETREFLRNNSALVADYPDYTDELEYIFTLEEERNPELLGHKDFINTYLKKEPHHLSSFSFANIFLWKDFFDFKIELIQNQLCIFATHETGTFLYLPPLGTGDKGKAVEECFRIMRKRNKNSAVSRIENIEDQSLRFYPAENFSLYKKSYEFCYYKDDILNLTGNIFKSKRSSYNQFVKRYNFEYLLFESGMMEECLKLYDTWSENRAFKNEDEIYRHMLIENRHVHGVGMRFFRELGLSGRVVKVEGAIKGYTFGYPLNEKEFCVLFEITDLAIDGLSVFIFHELCQDPELKRVSFINVMDDFELKNIEATKMSFRPAVLFPAYVGKLK